MKLVELIDGRKIVRLSDGTDLTVLDGVTLGVGGAETVAVLGRSGSGKTTLLSVLGLIEPLTSGTLRVEGQDVGKIGPGTLARLRGRLFGFIYQRFCLMDHLNALENVEAPLVHLGRGTRRSRRQRAIEALERVGLGKRLRHRPSQLSGGEQQRVAIARAIVHEPTVILADEPTGSLDQQTGALVNDLLFSLTEASGTALVIVTHEPEIASRCQRIIRLDRGSILAG